MPSQVVIWKKRILIPFTILFSIFVLAACEKHDTPPAYSVTQNYFPAQPIIGGSQYGYRMLLSENYLFVAAPSATVLDDFGNPLVKGTVYVYRNMDGSWKPTQILEDPSLYNTAAGIISFGASMDWENGLLAIGNASQDLVQLYRLDSRNLWQLTQTIAAPTFGTQFGFALSLNQGDLAVGAPSLGTPGTVELYSPDSSGNYQHKATLSCTVAPCNVAGSQVGESVKMVNGRVVAGSPGSNTALVFHLSGDGTWQSQILTGSDLIGGDLFGTQVHFDGSRIVISAPLATGGVPSGAIYIFDEVSSNTWGEKLIIGPKNPVGNEQFGQSFIYNNNTLVVGSSFANTGGGAVSIFNTVGRDNFIESQYFQHTGITANLGMSLAFDGHRIFAGAPFDQVDITGTEGGLYLLQTATTKDVILEGRAGPIP